MTDFFDHYPQHVLDRLRRENEANQQARVDRGEILYEGCVNGPGPNLRPCRCPYCDPVLPEIVVPEDFDLDAIANFDSDDDDFDPNSDEAYQQDVNDSLYP